MSAPALIALARGSRDSRATATVTALVSEIRAERPGLVVEAAFLGRAKPSFTTVVDRLVARGHDEIVIVPVLLTDTFLTTTDLPAALVAAAERHPGLQLHATPVLGLEQRFLQIVDARMRQALRLAHARELDALVLASVGSTDPLVNQSIARLARLWGAHHRLPVVAAYAAAAPPATGDAVRALRAEGRRHIAVGSFFLSPGQLTDRAAELALEAGAIAVAAPLGPHAEIARTVLARYAVGAVELVPV
jgi:sirohydrochlorin ferrochelatase